MIHRIRFAAVLLLACGAARAQDVQGIELCTHETRLDRRTNCLQSNVEYLQQLIAKTAAEARKTAADAQQKLNAASNEINALKAALAALQASVDKLQAAKREPPPSRPDAKPDAKPDTKKDAK